MRFILQPALILLFSVGLNAQSIPQLDEIQAVFAEAQARADIPLEQWDAKYKQELQKQFQTAQSAGDLDLVLAVKKEMEHPGRAIIPQDAPTLTRLRKIYDRRKARLDRERQAILSTADATRRKKLLALQQALTRADRIPDALAVKAALDGTPEAGPDESPNRFGRNPVPPGSDREFKDKPSSAAATKTPFILKQRPATHPKEPRPPQAVPVRRPQRGQPIDVIALLDLEKDVQHGKWEKRNGELHGLTTHIVPRFHIPYIPPEEYDFELAWSQPKLRHSLWMSISKGTSRLAFHHGKNAAGFGFINGLKYKDPKNPSHAVTPEQQPDTKYTMKIEVRKDRLKGYIDGKLVSDIPNDPSTWSVDSWKRMKDPTVPAIGVDDPTVFYYIRITPLSGSGKLLERK